MEKTEVFHHFDPVGVDAAEANKLRELPLGERTLTREDSSSFDMETAVKEAGRCMNCACYAVSPSDVTPVLVMADAQIVTTERIISAEELFTAELTVQDVLAEGELVKEIHVPHLKGTAHYDKKRVRDAIDFAIVSLASCLDVQDGVIREARIVYGGVAPVPYRMRDVEELLKDRTVSEELAEQAAELAVSRAVPMGKNEYKLYMMKDLMRTAVIRAGE